MDKELMRYRKKPVVVEAVQFSGLWEDAPKIIAFTEGKAFERSDLDFKRQYLSIETLEGVMNISPKDWVIKGVKGEFYPCKPDIFEATYEPALEAKPQASIDAVYGYEAGDKDGLAERLEKATNNRSAICFCGGDGCGGSCVDARDKKPTDALSLQNSKNQNHDKTVVSENADLNTKDAPAVTIKGDDLEKLLKLPHSIYIFYYDGYHIAEMAEGHELNEVIHMLQEYIIKPEPIEGLSDAFNHMDEFCGSMILGPHQTKIWAGARAYLKLTEGK